MPTPHDALFCQVFSDPRHAAGEIRAVLPTGLAALVDWSTLVAAPTALKDVARGDRHADLLFSVEIGSNPTYLYLLLEHKSHDEREPVLRLLEYATRIMLRHAREHPEEGSLPPVLAVVVHHGPGTFRRADDLRSRYQLGSGLRAILEGYIPQFRVVVDDLTRTPPEVLASRTMSAMAKLGLVTMQRATSNRSLAAILRGLGSHFAAAHREGGDPALLAAVLSYLGKVRDTPLREVQEAIRVELGPDMEEMMISTYDQVLQEGHARGFAEALREQIRARFGLIREDLEARIQAATPEELRRFVIRAVSARSLDEVFAHD
ncbi:MAG: Rpn family recombination-promoting nuclease/putative transposase [Planctomycetota bacterium]